MRRQDTDSVTRQAETLSEIAERLGLVIFNKKNWPPAKRLSENDPAMWFY
jgi:hypothetical protein